MLFCLFKKKLNGIMFILCTKEIAKDLKRKMRMWRVVQELMHIHKVKQLFCCIQIMLLMGFFNTLLLLTRDLLWKRTLNFLENQIVR